MEDDRKDAGPHTGATRPFDTPAPHLPAWAPAAPPDPNPDEYRDTRRRSIVARVCIGLSGALALIDGVLAMSTLGLAHTLGGTDPYSVDAVLADIERRDSTYGAGLALSLVALVAFLAWLVRALSNVRPLTGRQPKHTRRGAIGWWFVPIAWWFMPYRVVREVHESVDPMARAGSWRWLRLTWWMAFVVTPTLAVIGTIGLAVAKYPGTDQRVGDSLGMSEPFVLIGIGVEALTAFAAVLIIVLMGRIQACEDTLAMGSPEPEAMGRPERSPWIVPLVSVLGIAGVLVLSAGVATSPDYSGTWSRYAADDGTFTVDLPGTPTISSSNGWRVHQLDRGVSALMVASLDLGTDAVTQTLLDEYALAFVESEDLLEPTRETILDQQPARRVRYVDADGDEWTQIISGVGHRIVAVAELSLVRGSRSELDQVIETFRFTGEVPPDAPEPGPILTV